MEKRKHVRLSAMWRVEVVAQGGEPQEAYIAGIGRGGLGLYLHQELKPSQLVLVNLTLGGANAAQEQLKIVARVRWASPAGRLNMAGLSFERMSETRYARLLRHFNNIETLQLGAAGEAPVSRKARFSAKT
jgi:hypothetical protein